MELAQQVQYSGTGRRKDATARVRLVPGSGKITMNGKAIEDYIPFANYVLLLTNHLMLLRLTVNTMF